MLVTRRAYKPKLSLVLRFAEKHSGKSTGSCRVHNNQRTTLTRSFRGAQGYSSTAAHQHHCCVVGVTMAAKFTPPFISTCIASPPQHLLLPPLDHCCCTAAFRVRSKKEPCRAASNLVVRYPAASLFVCIVYVLPMSCGRSGLVLDHVHLDTWSTNCSVYGVILRGSTFFFLRAGRRIINKYLHNLSLFYSLFHTSLTSVNSPRSQFSYVALT